MHRWTREDRAWAAGLFDGEGHAKIASYPSMKGRVVPLMQLTMTDFDAVERFAGIVGAGTLCEPQPQEMHHKPQLLWRATNRNAQAAAQALIEFSFVKVEALREIVQHYVNFHVRVASIRARICKLTEKDVREIRRSSLLQIELAARYGVSTSQISVIRNRLSWTHVKD